MTAEAADRLRFHLSMQEGFWFALVAADDPAFRQALRRVAEEEPGDVYLHRPGLGELSDLAAVLVAERRPGLHWVVTEPEGTTAREAEEALGRLLMGLNERREALRRHLPGGLVVEGPARSKVLLRNLAPDLFSIRACILEPAGAGPAVQERSPWWLGELDVADRATVRQWGQPAVPWQRWQEPVRGAGRSARWALAEAERLEGRSEIGARRSRLASLARAAEALLAQGWIGEAAPVAEALLAQASELVDEGGGEGLTQAEAAEVPGLGQPSGPAAAAIWARSLLAEAHEATAVVAFGQGDVQQAADHWRQALTLREELLDDAVLDPSTAPRYAEVARCDSRLGELAVVEGDLARAEAHLVAARDLRQRLVDAFPEHPGHRADLALSWSLLGDLYLDRGEVPSAEGAFRRALHLRQELVEARPGDPRHRAALGVAWGRVGVVAAARGELRTARQAAEEALRLGRELAAEDPGHAGWQSGLAIAWSRLGDARRAEGDAAGAREAYDHALRIRQELFDEDPENARWQRYLAVVLARRGDLERAEGALEDAQAQVDEALELSEGLAWQDPANTSWLLGLAEVRAVAADLAEDRGEPVEAQRLRDLARQGWQRAVDLGLDNEAVARLRDRLG